MPVNRKKAVARAVVASASLQSPASTANVTVPARRVGKRGGSHSGQRSVDGAHCDRVSKKGNRKAQAASEGTESKLETAVPEYVDDLLSGFAEMFTSAVAVGHKTRKVVDTIVYPVKEAILEAHDGVGNALNPAPGGWSVLKASAMTFAHDDDLAPIQVEVRGRASKTRDTE